MSLSACPCPQCPVAPQSACFTTSLASHCVRSCDMPCTMDWRSCPLNTVTTIFQKHNEAAAATANPSADWESAAEAYFSTRLSDYSQVEALPSLNTVNINHLHDGQLVRFRCMIQDMFDPELYLSTFQVKDLSTGATRLDTAKYRDLTPLGPREEVVEDPAKTITKDRQSFYCVSIPAEAPWVVGEFNKRASATSWVSEPQINPLKRSLNEENDDEGDMEVEMQSQDKCDEVEHPELKKAKNELGNSEPRNACAKASEKPSLNLPIANPKGVAAIVKHYDLDATFSLNDTVEFVGILSLDPALATLPADGSEHDIFEFLASQGQQQAVPAPNRAAAAVVPRLHVLQARRLVHSNPLLPQELPSALEDLAEVEQCRSAMHAILTQATLGDELAAEYLICHLLSKVYLRKDVLTLGKFSLNLHNVPASDNYTRRLTTILQLLASKLHYLPMSIEALNGGAFIPRKDNHANRLVSGALQLSPHTNLVLDETRMCAGQLNPEGVRNLTAIGNLIRWQKVEYDFSYYNIDYVSDVPCLILSEGRTMLPCDIQVMAKPSQNNGASAVSDAFSAIGSFLTESMLEKLRKYLTIMQHLPFDVSDEMQKLVQDDFVSERQQAGGAEAMTAEDLHSLLVLARLLSLSYGSTRLTSDTWNKVKAMEKERKERVAHLPARPVPSPHLA